MLTLLCQRLLKLTVSINILIVVFKTSQSFNELNKTILTPYKFVNTEYIQEKIKANRFNNRNNIIQYKIL